MIRTFLYSLSISLAGLLTQAAQAQVKPAGDTSIKKTAVDTTARKPAQRPPVTAAPTKKAVDTSGPRTAQRPTAAPVPAKKPDSIYYVPGGLRLGIDISRFALHFFQPYRTDVAVQADVRLNKKLYGAFEVGYNRTSHSDSSYTYKGSGAYATVGIDYDFLKKKDPSDKNMVYGGIHYGFARNTYEVPAYNIHNKYWDSETPGSFPKTNMTAHWIELTFGMRVEALPNFFLGWAVREKIMVSNNAVEGFDPIIIPGFGSGSKSSQFDMTYTVSYYLPLYKLKIRESREPKKKKD
ncbi:DUF6048 family protein [Chitinophaga filiformis]|uniref:Outer membrane protein beta-barrel domain-containing protein n=1 Tax=Chitinophaga filiformis TaxID=104663 RepID=A0A1G7HZV2_CHIFI|nr:DUF6048 family protein [Chitinophaga filiformis]SDF05654.1 hypothetical protein SAMN04488121_101654 [Chitinophaga filiformis]